MNIAEERALREAERLSRKSGGGRIYVFKSLLGYRWHGAPGAKEHGLALEGAFAVFNKGKREK